MNRAERRQQQQRQQRSALLSVQNTWAGVLSLYALKGKNAVVDYFNEHFSPKADYDVELSYMANFLVDLGREAGKPIDSEQASRFLEVCKMIDKGIGAALSSARSAINQNAAAKSELQPLREGKIQAMRDSEAFTSFRLNLMNIYVTTGKALIAECFNGLLYRMDGAEKDVEYLLERILQLSLDTFCDGEDTAAYRHHCVVMEKLDKALGRA